MIRVPDVAVTLDWYVSMGFSEMGRCGDPVNWGMASFGNAEMFIPGKPDAADERLWFYSHQVKKLYELLKSRQLAVARAVLADEPGDRGIEFVEHLYTPPYGGREFGIRDLNGHSLFFLQSAIAPL